MHITTFASLERACVFYSPVAGTAIPTAALTPEMFTTGSLAAAAAAAVPSFIRHPLTQQMRAAAPSEERHREMIAALQRSMPVGASPVRQEDLDVLRYLSADDIEADPTWRWAPICVTGNRERAELNYVKAIEFARYHGRPVLAWHQPVTATAGTTISPRELQDLRFMDRRFCNVFVIGAPAF